jgi:hypothetical protein
MTDYLSQFLFQGNQQNQKKRSFISFDYEHDEGLKNALNAQSKNPNSPFYFEDWSVKEPFPQSTWQSDVRTKIKQCNFMIVIIGASTHQASGVLTEIKIANEENIPCFGIYEQGKNYYVPNGLDKRFVPWTWDYIVWAINNLKNYYPSYGTK